MHSSRAPRSNRAPYMALCFALLTFTGGCPLPQGWPGGGGDPTTDPGDPDMLAAFHHGALHGTRPVLLLMVGFEDEPLSYRPDEVDGLVFSDPAGNAAAHLEEMSNGRFGIASGAQFSITHHLGAFSPTYVQHQRALHARTGDHVQPFVTIVRDVDTDGDGDTDGVRYLHDAGTNVRVDASPSSPSVRLRHISWFVADLNGGLLRSGDEVALRTSDGDWLSFEPAGAQTRFGGDRPPDHGVFIASRLSAEPGGDEPHRYGDGFELRTREGELVTYDADGVLALGGSGQSVLRWEKSARFAPFTAYSALQDVVASGVDLASVFDEDENGRIEADEMAVVMVTAAQPDGPLQDVGGARRQLDTLNVAGGVSIRPRGFVTVPEHTALATLTHELTHLVGNTEDVYGACGPNGNMSLMSATIVLSPDNRHRYHLDPWHKLRMGWVDPIVREMGSSLHTEIVQAASEAEERPILIYDPDDYDLQERTGEFYLVEYRRPTGYDANVLDEGIAVWHVGVEPSGRLQRIEGFRDGCSDTGPALVYVGVDEWMSNPTLDEIQPLRGQHWFVDVWDGRDEDGDGRVDQRLYGGLIRQNNVEIPLQRFDGTDTGIRLYVRNRSWAPNEMQVIWYR